MEAAGRAAWKGMHMILPRRLRVAPLLLTLLLIAGPLAAATGEPRPREGRQSRLGVTALLSEAWTLVSRIFEPVGHPTAIFEKSGSSIDPFGKPDAQPPGPSATVPPPTPGS